MDNSAADCRRIDATLANVVEIGLAYHATIGYPAAKIYLLEQGVRKDIIVRVLTIPDRRRRVRPAAN